MPSRADIVPAELTLHLPQILLADVLDEGKEFRYRLLGTRLTPYFPDRATGKTFTEALGPFGAVTVNGTIAVMGTRLVGTSTDVDSSPAGVFSEM